MNKMRKAIAVVLAVAMVFTSVNVPFGTAFAQENTTEQPVVNDGAKVEEQADIESIPADDSKANEAQSDVKNSPAKAPKATKVVAKIGANEYASFVEAFNAAKEGETITVVNGFIWGNDIAKCTGKLVNVELGGEGHYNWIDIAEDVTWSNVQMNFKVLSNKAFVFENQAVTDKITLTINNGSKINVDGTNAAKLAVMSADATVNIEGAGTQLNAKNLKGNATNGGAFNVKNGASLTIDGATNYGLSCNSLNIDNATVDVKNTGFSGIYTATNGVTLKNSANLNVEKCGKLLPLESQWSHTYAPVQLKNGDVSVDKNSNINLKNNVDKNGNQINFMHSNNKAVENNYAAAEIEGTHGITLYLNLDDAVAANPDKKFTAGKFTVNPAGHVAEGYEAIKSGDHWIVVTPDQAQAAIGTDKYMTLKEAVAAAKDGDTVRLINDVVMPNPKIGKGLIPDITIKKNLTLDLNKHTIKREEAIGNTNVTPAFSLLCQGLKL